MKNYYIKKTKKQEKNGKKSKKISEPKQIKLRNIKEIKRSARIKLGESIKGDNLVFLAFAFRVSFTIIAIISLANRWYGFNNTIIGLIISLQIPYIPLYYSFKRKVLKISKEANDTNYDYGDFLYYYKHNPLTVIAVELMQNLFLFLWLFTIVGVFIKALSYRMTSYLKIENEELSARDAIKKSMEIMKSTKATTLQSRITLPKPVLSVNFFILEFILYY